MILFHGSDVEIRQPDISFNTGFSDLGPGFYLTDDQGVAAARARSRARKTGAESGVVSVFEFDETALPWVLWDGHDAPELPLEVAKGQLPFGLRFGTSAAGIAAWANYIKACRAGHTAIGEQAEQGIKQENLGAGEDSSPNLSQQLAPAVAHREAAGSKGSAEPATGQMEPAVVRAWIATEDIEMVCAGFAPAEELAAFIDPQTLVVQYCFRAQEVLDQLLAFVRADSTS